MSDLIKAMKKRIEPDENLLDNESDNYARSLSQPDKVFVKEKKDFISGARWQSEQLKPVLLAMCECVEALERCEYLDTHAVSPARRTLARLKEAVEAK